MHPADIQALIKKENLTQKEIAKRLGVSATLIHLVIHKRVVSHSVMSEMARLLGINVHLLWPEYYSQKPKRSTSHARGF